MSVFPISPQILDSGLPEKTSSEVTDECEMKISSNFLFIVANSIKFSFSFFIFQAFLQPKMSKTCRNIFLCRTTSEFTNTKFYKSRRNLIEIRFLPQILFELIFFICFAQTFRFHLMKLLFMFKHN